jgi:hypothetical protein
MKACFTANRTEEDLLPIPGFESEKRGEPKRFLLNVNPLQSLPPSFDVMPSVKALQILPVA